MYSSSNQIVEFVRGFAADPRSDQILSAALALSFVREDRAPGFHEWLKAAGLDESKYFDSLAPLEHCRAYSDVVRLLEQFPSNFQAAAFAAALWTHLIRYGQGALAMGIEIAIARAAGGRMQRKAH